MKRRDLISAITLIAAAVASPVEAATVKLQIMAGQSNLLGSSTVPYSAQYADQLVKLYPDLTIFVDDSSDMRDDEYPAGDDAGLPRFAQSITRAAQNLAPVTHSARGLGGALTGPEVQFGRLLQTRYGAAQKIVIAKFAIGGSTLSRQWLNSGTVDFSDQLLIAVAQIKQQIEAAGDTVVIEGFSWIQGTNDTGFQADADKYLANLRTLVGKVRRFAGNQKLPVVIELTSIDMSKLSPADKQRRTQPLATINAAQRSFVQSTPCTALVHMERFPHSDAFHYQGASYYPIGQAFYVGHAGILNRAECALTTASAAR
jgi:hypothetical protein